MELSTTQTIGWSTILGGIISLVSFVALLLMFAGFSAFGPLNDFLAIPSSLLLLPLVIGLYRLQAADRPVLDLIALVAGVAGFVITMTGSTLLLTHRIDFQGSLVPAIGGFALIGLFVLLNSLMSLDGMPLPRGIAWAGLLLAVVPSALLLGVFWSGRIGVALTTMAGQTTGFQTNPLLIALIVLGLVSYGGLPVWFILVGRQFALGKVVATAVGAAI